MNQVIHQLRTDREVRLENAERHLQHRSIYLVDVYVESSSEEHVMRRKVFASRKLSLESYTSDVG